MHRHDDGGTKEFSTEAGWKFSVFAGEEFDLANGETTSFIPVFALDPTDTSITYGASNRALYRSTQRGEHSVRIGPAGNSSGVPSSISVSPVNPRVVWMATGTGAIYRYDVSAAGTATATRLNAGLPNRFIAQIVAGYDSADTVYAVFNGYDANTPGTPGKVFVSHDRGATWQNASGNLPDVPANALALDPTDPNRIWLATDAAVYSTHDGGQTWQSERRNMPVVTVMDLVYHAKSGDLVAATYGRGIWRMRVGG
jgi:Sortilin, neurotensin receptor 3,